MTRRFGFVVFVVAAMLVAGCSLLPGGPVAEPTVEPTAEPTLGGTISGVANVENVDVLIMESFPVQVSVVAQGNLPDGCTELADWSVTRDGTTFKVTLPTERPADAVCTEALEPFEARIPLDVLGLEAGTYTVDVNGVTATFELAVDNVLQEEPDTSVNPCEVLRAEGEAVFTNPAAGYCLRYPDAFTVTEPEPDVVVIHGPDYSGGGLEPLSGFVNIQATEPANGRTAAEVSDGLLAAITVPEGTMIERVDTLLGGVPAVEIIAVPGQRLDWHVVAVQNERVVHLVFSPLGEEYGEADADRELLYQSVMASFTFLQDDGTVGEGQWPNAAQAARFVLQQAVGASAGQVTIVSAEPAEFSDACLGLGGPAESCLAAITPGYIVTLSVAGQTYVYHTDETGGSIRLASGPQVAIGSPLLSWRQESEDGCSELVLGANAGAAGLCDAPHVTAPLMADFVTRNLSYFDRAYAPFEADTPAGSLVFTGTGALGAMPVEQRMIAEYARVAAGVVQWGRMDANQDLAMRVNRTGGIAGFCDHIAISVTGEVHVASCKAEPVDDVVQGRLTALELERLYAWLDAYESYEFAQMDDAVADSMDVHLVFNGTGDTGMPIEVTQEILTFMDELYARLVLGELRPANAPFWLTLPDGWQVGQTRETVLGTLTVIGTDPMNPRAENSAIYVAEAADVTLEHAVKRIFCGPSDCEPDVELVDTTVAGVPAQRSVPADGVEIAWHFLQHAGRTITFTLYDPETKATLQETIDTIRWED
ncbi:MAG: hypothetical protein JXC32_05740 [Anaerolineae bacterium]|nr:hypothetical protein [Anaerolineae bacterium]